MNVLISRTVIQIAPPWPRRQSASFIANPLDQMDLTQGRLSSEISREIQPDYTSFQLHFRAFFTSGCFKQQRTPLLPYPGEKLLMLPYPRSLQFHARPSIEWDKNASVISYCSFSTMRKGKVINRRRECTRIFRLLQSGFARMITI